MGNRTGMDYLEKYRALGFNRNQLTEIEEGLKKGIDVDIYAKPEYVFIQMRQIRLGLEDGLPVDIYAIPEYDWFQMEEIRKGLISGVRVEKYARPSVSYDRMRQIREGLEVNIDLSPYVNMSPGVLGVLRQAVLDKVSIFQFINEGYDEVQLDEIRTALTKGLDIKPYLSTEFRGICIREIAAGLFSNIDVSLYAKPEYNWRQMREIRLGLENRVEVKTYLNPLYDWEQMREIRLGLMHGVEIVSFRSLMYPGVEMEKIRLSLEEKAKEEEAYWLSRILWKDNFDRSGRVLCADSENKVKEYDDFSVVLSQDEMEAVFVLKGNPHPINKGLIDDVLEKYGITAGIDDLAVSRMVNGDWKDNQLSVARGRYPEAGTDGWYEYFFRTEVARTPRILPDGSVDYHDIEWYEMTRRGAKIAEYHPAGNKKDGFTVTGKTIPGRKGNELPVLNGVGFRVDETGCNYYAMKDGIINLTGDYLEIKDLLVLNEVSLATGNIRYDGNVYIKGNVYSGMVIQTGGDLVIDGFVEKVYIECGGNVVLHQGVNSSGEGEIRAKGDVIGKFFEAVKIRAGGSIRANYSMNSELYAEKKIKIGGRNGSLVGGTASAELGVEVYDLGNKASAATVVCLGSTDAQLEKQRKIEQVKATQKKVHEEMAVLNRAYREYQDKYPPKIRNGIPVYLKIEAAIYTKELQLTELDRMKNTIENTINGTARAEILVIGTLFEGVTVFIGKDKILSRHAKKVRIKKYNEHIGIFTV